MRNELCSDTSNKIKNNMFETSAICKSVNVRLKYNKIYVFGSQILL